MPPRGQSTAICSALPGQLRIITIEAATTLWRGRPRHHLPPVRSGRRTLWGDVFVGQPAHRRQPPCGRRRRVCGRHAASARRAFPAVAPTACTMIGPNDAACSSTTSAPRQSSSAATNVDAAADRCASRSAAILYGKEPGLGLVLARSRCFVTQRPVYGVLSWRAMWNARHVPGRGSILHAINRPSILGVDMACNTTSPCDGLPTSLATDLP
jgi:hypothetical protein